MLAQRWPCVVMPTQEKVSLPNFYVTNVDVDQTLVPRKPTLNISQQYNGLLTLAQRCHAIWEIHVDDL